MAKNTYHGSLVLPALTTKTNLFILVCCLFWLSGFPLPSFAWSLKGAFKDFFGPSVDDVGYSYSFIREVTGWNDSPGPFDCHNSIQLTIKNNSGFYIDKAIMICDVFDASKNRLSKSQQFTFYDARSTAIAPGNTTTWKAGICKRSADFVQCELKKLSGEK